jgi:hypothetical protein
MTGSAFRAVVTAGAILPADALGRIASLSLSGQGADDYALTPGLNVNNAIARSWADLSEAWRRFSNQLAQTPTGEATTRLTRERWLLPLLTELGWGKVPPTASGITLPPRTGETAPGHYPISHHQTWPDPASEPIGVAVHLLGAGVDLDRRTPGITARAPHGMVQEFLNRNDRYLFGILSNGVTLRLLRDSSALARQTQIDFDLDLIFTERLYDDFRLLWLTLHATRFAPRATAAPAPEVDAFDDTPAETDDTDPEPTTGAASFSPDDCWFEDWRHQALTDGARARTDLEHGIAAALTALGTGFVSHPDNQALREHLADNNGLTDDLRRWLLRIVYRLLVLFVAEDRELLHDPDSQAENRQLYDEHFSTARLRRLAASRPGTSHTDLWQAHQLVTTALGTDGLPALALPALAASLYDPDAIGLLAPATLTNRNFLAAIRHLSQLPDKRTGATTPIDFRNLDSEELGGVYESLLAYVPRYDPDEQTFTLIQTAGSERKKSGSYYTPTDLIALVLDEALNPLVAAATQAKDPERALLDITVCDPACGSGHFLVAAARRIARALATVRSNDPEPAPSLLREAIRDVISHCVYGVDINPLALEVAKVALWLDALTPGKPLAFLDPHFKVGNALLGTTPALLRTGIPDSAFAVLEGDDKDHVRKLKARNKAERRHAEQVAAGQTTLAFESDPWTTAAASRQAADLDSMPLDNAAQVRAKADAWRRLEAAPELTAARRMADTWCTAFVQPADDRDRGITQDTFTHLAERAEHLKPELAMVEHLAREYQFFHWHLEFPSIYAVPDGIDDNVDPDTGWAGGFTCVLGNPPWERVKIQDKEWFAAHGRDDIATAATKAKRDLLINSLDDDDPATAAAYGRDKRQAEGTAHLLLNSGRYPLTGRGDVNTYSVFAETFRTLLAPAGRAGLITPTGLATDATTAPFFADTLASTRLVAFYDFENEAKIFENVHHAFRFATTVLTGRQGTSGKTRFAFYTRHVRDVPSRRFELTAEEVLQLNPNTGTLPVFRSRRDADITTGIYRRHPVLIRDDDPNGNPWGLSFMTMFHMANDSGLFRDADDLASARSEGWTQTLDGSTYVPLYEAKMLSHFDHRFSTYAGATQAQLNMNTLPRFSEADHDNPASETVPRYWVDKRKVIEALAGRWNRDWLLGWRDITNTSNERTLITAVLPMSAIGHKFPLALPGQTGRAFLLHATWSSVACDFVCRQKLGGSGMSYFIFKQIAVPRPETFSNPTPWLTAVTLADWIRPYVLELSYTSDRLAPYAEDLGDQGPPFRWDNNRRALLRAELDAAFMHIYGLTREETEHVLDSFFVVRKHEERDFGEFRTRRLVLDAYDAMAAAACGGSAWKSLVQTPAGRGSRHDPPALGSPDQLSQSGVV